MVEVTHEKKVIDGKVFIERTIKILIPIEQIEKQKIEIDTIYDVATAQ